MILIDPPTWPAHGTVFSHLVSDESLNELHAFARANDISPRAFDLDHYDVPAHLYDLLTAAGAQPVDGGTLTKRLIASGLRVPLKERPHKIRPTLLRQWEQLLPGDRDLGEHLLDRWEDSRRTYHNSAHLLEMLGSLKTFYEGTQVPRAVQLAAWLHDIVYEAEPGKDESASADFARDILTPLVKRGELQAQELSATVCLIEATVSHEPAQTPSLEATDALYFLDADLAILGADSARYRRYVAGVRREYSRYSDAEFARGRAQVLEGFLARKQIFATAQAGSRYGKRARLNIENELLAYR